jgi:hypothetical protein
VHTLKLKSGPVYAPGVRRGLHLDAQEYDAIDKAYYAAWSGAYGAESGLDGLSAGPGGYCSPRHWVSCNSRDEGAKCVG